MGEITNSTDMDKEKHSNENLHNENLDDSRELDREKEEEPEEASNIITRQRFSRLGGDPEMLRFSKASSLEQNFLVDVD